MEPLNVIFGVASILGLVFSALAFWQAKNASRAAREARDNAIMRTLADELEIACLRTDQLTDFLAHGRIAEAALRAQELTSSLSEIPSRRGPYLKEPQINSLLTIREQLSSIHDAIGNARKEPDRDCDIDQFIKVASRANMNLREVLGKVKSRMELGVTDGQAR